VLHEVLLSSLVSLLVNLLLQKHPACHERVSASLHVFAWSDFRFVCLGNGHRIFCIGTCLLGRRPIHTPQYIQEKNLRSLVVLWVVLVLAAHIWMAAISSYVPVTPWEQSVPSWPPSAPILSWLGRVCCAPFERWDAEYYLRIASDGYRADDGTAQFHPLYPALSSLLVRLGTHPLPALLLVGIVAATLFLAAFYVLARSDLSPLQAQFAVLSFVLGPFGVALVLTYSEGLFLLFGVLALYWAKQRRWLLSGLAGALATLTRQQGLFLVLPLGCLALAKSNAPDGSSRPLARPWTRWLALVAIPVAYLAFVGYRAGALCDFSLGRGGFQDFVYSLFISPSANQVVPVQSFLWPWIALWRSIQKLWIAPDLDIVVNLVGGAWFLTLLVLSWRYLSNAYKIYTLTIVCLSFAYYTGPVHPYMGLLRHLSLAFPVFLGLSRCIQSRGGKAWYLAISAVGQLFLLLLYALEAWVP